MTTITSKTARQQLIIDVLGRQAVYSQNDLADLLQDAGVNTTPSTLSRDLDELDAERVRRADGTLVYAVPSEGGDRTPRPAVEYSASHSRLKRIMREFVVSADASANIVVLRTPPGAAQYVASAVDHADDARVLGTIAGDDTVFVTTREPEHGTVMAENFRAWASSEAESPESPASQGSPAREDQ